MGVLLPAVAVIGFMPFAVRSAQGQTINVAPGDVAGLISAIQTANSNSGTAAVIHVSGTYTLSPGGGIPFSADGNNGLPSITTEVTIIGAGAVIERDDTPACDINGTEVGTEFRLFHVASTGKLMLEGLTLRHGCADGAFPANSGGGILNRGETILRGTTLSSNFADTGGGIINLEGTVKVLDGSLLSENEADNSGGGIENDGTSAIVEINESSLWQNKAQFFGGGITNFNGKVYVTASSVSSNSSGTEGGGVFNTFSGLNVPVLKVTTSTFYDNESTRGGGIFTSEKVDVVGSTFTENRAGEDGGGIWKEGLELNVTNSTFSGNMAQGVGGGIYNDSFDLNVTSCTFVGNSATTGGGIRFFDTVNIVNSIVANSPSGGDCAGHASADLFATGTNFDTDGTCKAAAAASGTGAAFSTVSFAALNLGDLALNPPGLTATHALLEDSVAIDAVAPGECTVAHDQRGVGRPQGPSCDSGAYEVLVPRPSPVLSLGPLLLTITLLGLFPWYQSRRKRRPHPRH